MDRVLNATAGKVSVEGLMGSVELVNELKVYVALFLLILFLLLVFVVASLALWRLSILRMTAVRLFDWISLLGRLRRGAAIGR